MRVEKFVLGLALIMSTSALAADGDTCKIAQKLTADQIAAELGVARLHEANQVLLGALSDFEKQRLSAAAEQLSAGDPYYNQFNPALDHGAFYQVGLQTMSRLKLNVGGKTFSSATPAGANYARFVRGDKDYRETIVFQSPSVATGHRLNDTELFGKGRYNQFSSVVVREEHDMNTGADRVVVSTTVLNPNGLDSDTLSELSLDDFIASLQKPCVEPKVADAKVTGDAKGDKVVPAPVVDAKPVVVATPPKEANRSPAQ
ncbi:MAG: hypothetical protein HY075_05225 [Deltaproteobacteria bacterium]|nr:hypothetical protein [Deltaproteobacteria bacterium]